MLVRSLTLSIFLALVLFVPNLNASEPEWPELQNNLDEIEFGLQMIEAPLSEIEDLQAQKEQRLIETAQDLTQRELRLVLKETLLNEREQGLSEREKGLDFQEILFNDMGNDLAKVNRKLENGWKWILGSLIVGVTGGIAIDELIEWLGSR